MDITQGRHPPLAATSLEFCGSAPDGTDRTSDARVVKSAQCLNIDYPEGIHVDHNLYFGTVLAGMREQMGRRILAAWQYVSGLDAHSVQMPVEFSDDLTPTSVSSWALDRATTAEWGASEFAGV